jgi:hypothetical protein
VIERGFDVDPSAHRVNTSLVSGPPCGDAAVTEHAVPFVHVTWAGAVYVPAGQPDPLIENCAPATFAPMATTVGAVEKLAVTATGAVIVNTSGLAVLEPAPLHDVN